MIRLNRMNTSLTFKQQSNYDGFPKAAELIEIEGAHALEASDRAVSISSCRPLTTADG